MSRHDEREKPTAERNERALRQTRRQLDADIAEIADNAKGAEALEQPALPDRSHGNPEAEDGR